jgi:TatD DNase family protein
MYVDVHTHLTHERFTSDADAAAERAARAGVVRVLVNGLEPLSNRRTLELSERHENVFAALGIYPVDAACHAIDRERWPHAWAPPPCFDIDEEIAFIEANAHRIVAVGECGLDAHWAPETLPAQEAVLRALCEVAVRNDLPVILHTRRAEERSFEIVREMGVVRADFHCFGGGRRLGVRIAEQGYHLSIPTVVTRAEEFQALARALPVESILTETDAPYLSPRKGVRNEPSFIPDAVAAIAKARGEREGALAEQIVRNFNTIFTRCPVPGVD